MGGGWGRHGHCGNEAFARGPRHSMNKIKPDGNFSIIKIKDRIPKVCQLTALLGIGPLKLTSLISCKKLIPFY